MLSANRKKMTCDQFLSVHKHGQKKFKDIIIQDANLEGDLHGIELTNSVLAGANLMKANLSDARLVFTDSRNANLSEANLSGADLTGAYFHSAILIKTNLKKTRLDQISFIRAILYLADFRDADVNFVRFYGAKLAGTTFSKGSPPNLSNEQHKNSHFW